MSSLCLYVTVSVAAFLSLSLLSTGTLFYYIYLSPLHWNPFIYSPFPLKPFYTRNRIIPLRPFMEVMLRSWITVFFG
jgi:hypothetical protein